VDKVMQSKRSLTGKFLRGEERIEIPPHRRAVERPAGGMTSRRDRENTRVGSPDRTVS